MSEIPPLLAPNIATMVRQASQRFGEREALVDRELRWTFNDLDGALVESVRAAMAFGIAPGDRVGLWSPNSAEWIIAALGILGAGGILVPLNTRWTGAEVGYALEKADASSLFVAQGFLDHDQVGDLRAAAPGLRAHSRVVALEGDDPASMTWADYLSGADTVTSEEAHRQIALVDPDDISDIMFTSGTTGRPKGVILKHGPSLRVYPWLLARFGMRPGDRHLVVPPFFHCYGYKAGWMGGFALGVTILPQRVFDVDQAMERIQRERVSVLLGPPTIFTEIMNHPRRSEYDLSSLRISSVSAAAIPVELVHRMRDELGFESVITAYGLTENHAVVSSCSPDDAPEDIVRSAGHAAPGVEVKIVDDEGRQLPAGQAGEIWLSGYLVTDGYWHDPQATAEAIDADGWLKTGDIGVLDDRGFLSITDRKKDMVIVGGFNVYPAEIERVLLLDSNVGEVAVIAGPDERLGEVPIAFVVPKPGHTIDGEALIDWIRPQVANVKVPRKVFVVDSLPRNASMKVLKHELRDHLVAMTEPEG